jgi:thioredoxin 1
MIHLLSDVRRDKMAITNVTQDNFDAEVVKSEKPVLIDFWAAWCGPCKMVSPVIEEIANERDDIKVCKINIDEEQHLAMQYGIMSIPTMMVFSEGKPVKKVVGAVPKSEIEKALP